MRKHPCALVLFKTRSIPHSLKRKCRTFIGRFCIESSVKCCRSRGRAAPVARAAASRNSRIRREITSVRGKKRLFDERTHRHARYCL